MPRTIRIDQDIRDLVRENRQGHETVNQTLRRLLGLNESNSDKECESCGGRMTDTTYNCDNQEHARILRNR